MTLAQARIHVPAGDWRSTDLAGNQAVDSPQDARNGSVFRREKVRESRGRSSRQAQGGGVPHTAIDHSAHLKKEEETSSLAGDNASIRAHRPTPPLAIFKPPHSMRIATPPSFCVSPGQS